MGACSVQVDSVKMEDTQLALHRTAWCGENHTSGDQRQQRALCVAVGETQQGELGLPHRRWGLRPFSHCPGVTPGPGAGRLEHEARGSLLELAGR